MSDESTEKPTENNPPKTPNRWFWGLFIAAMGAFGAYNLYMALQSFGVIQ